MRFAIVLLCTALFSFIFKDAIRKVPWVFYVLALVLSGMYAITSNVAFPYWLQRTLFLLMQKGTLATAFFVVVMYIGVFDNIDLVKQRLKPTRAALSIMGCILILGHVVKYLLAFLPRMGEMSGSLAGSIWLAIALFVLMLVLGVTSFQAVKHRMNAQSWIKLQKTAYIFYGALYLHLMLVLLPPALRGSATATESVIVYSVVFVVYAILRIGKAIRDRRRAS